MKTTPRKAMERAALATGAVVFALAAQAAEPANYAGLHGGVNNLQNWPATVSLGPGVELPGNLTLDNGSHFGLIVGRQTENARFEVEAQAGRFDVTAIQLGPIQQGVSSSGRYKALTFNAYRTFAFSTNVVGYAGLGIGWGAASLPQLGFTGGCNCFAAASKTGLAYLGRLGLEYKFDDHHNAFVQYTALRLPSANSGGAPGTDYARKTVGIAGVGYRYVF